MSSGNESMDVTDNRICLSRVWKAKFYTMKSVYYLLLTANSGQAVYPIVALFPVYTLEIIHSSLLKHTWGL